MQLSKVQSLMALYFLFIMLEHREANTRALQYKTLDY